RPRAPRRGRAVPRARAVPEPAQAARQAGRPAGAPGAGHDRAGDRGGAGRRRAARRARHPDHRRVLPKGPVVTLEYIVLAGCGLIFLASLGGFALVAISRLGGGARTPRLPAVFAERRGAGRTFIEAMKEVQLDAAGRKIEEAFASADANEYLR